MLARTQSLVVILLFVCFVFFIAFLDCSERASLEYLWTKRVIGVLQLSRESRVKDLWQ